MSDGRCDLYDALARRLGELRPADALPRRSQERLHRALQGRRRRPDALAARLLAVRDAEADPLTGHRGADDALLACAEAGGLLVTFQVRREEGRRVLRGQVFEASGGAGPGGLVHARTAAGSALGCVDSSGEFLVADLPPGSVARLELELELNVIRIDLPPAAGEEP